MPLYPFLLNLYACYSILDPNRPDQQNIRAVLSTIMLSLTVLPHACLHVIVTFDDFWQTINK